MSSTDAAYSRIRLAKLNTHWPASETLFDRTMGEFTRWSTKLEIFLQQSGLDRYIFAPEKKPERLITQPDPKTEHCLRKLEGLDTDGMAKECYDTLKARAHHKGPVKQVALVREALSTYAPISEPIETTAHKICELFDRAFAISSIDKSLLKCIALLNSINDKSFESVQTQVLRGLADSTTEKPYTSSDIRKLFQTIDSLATLLKPSSFDTALLTRDSKGHTHNHSPGYPCCEVCFAQGLPCHGHTKEWCIRSGGGMARKTIEQSKAAQHAA
ncbi:hypothetical protein E4T56_gene9843 [Termitomyces sp. T112]|nr:hypothetical protein E4T56_gene9843 [Termitomyces sp. T112]